MHADMAAHARAVFRKVGGQSFHGFEHAACVVQQGIAGGGQFDAAWPAVEQGGIERAFQVADAFAHGRQRQVFAFGRGSEPACVGDRDEKTEGEQIDTRHGHFRDREQATERSCECSGFAIREVSLADYLIVCRQNLAHAPEFLAHAMARKE